jgi:hypothetical protein
MVYLWFIFQNLKKNEKGFSLLTFFKIKVVKYITLTFHLGFYLICPKVEKRIWTN